MGCGNTNTSETNEYNFGNSYPVPKYKLNNKNNVVYIPQPRNQIFYNPRDYKHCYICGEIFGERYYIKNTLFGINCCRCMKHSNFNKFFYCLNCNSEFCFKCGANL